MSAPNPQDETVEPIEEKRERINQIDAGILALLDERMRLAVAIGCEKRKRGRDIEDGDRERELMHYLLELNRQTILSDNQLWQIFTAILESSKEIQERTSCDVE